MSISVGFNLDVSGVRPGEETTSVVEALNALLIKHDLDRDVVVDEGQPGRVCARSRYPIIVAGFGAWADRIEQDSRDTVRAIAPAAQVALRWAFEDEDA